MTTTHQKPIQVNGIPLTQPNTSSAPKVQVDLDNLGEVFVTSPDTEESSTHDHHD